MYGAAEDLSMSILSLVLLTSHARCGTLQCELWNLVRGTARGAASSAACVYALRVQRRRVRLLAVPQRVMAQFS